jgi:hypothetical protein
MELAAFLETVSLERIDALPRRDQLGAALEFGEAAEEVRVVRELVERLERQPKRYVPTSVYATAQNNLDTFLQYIQGIEQFDPQIHGANERNAYIINVRNMADIFRDAVAPRLSAEDIPLAASADEIARAAADIAAKSAEAAVLVTGLHERHAEADAILGEIRGSSAASAAATLSTYYSGQAAVHARQAYVSLAIAALCVAAAFGLGIYYIGQPIQADPVSTNELVDYLRTLTPRLFVIGVLLYVVRAAVRNFSINRHLQVVYEQRRTALDTYGRFAQAVSPETQAAVVLELVKAIFGTAPTGYAELDGGKTVIENIQEALPRPPGS